jgi:TolB-like protein/Flp pilus assembly protein TadD
MKASEDEVFRFGGFRLLSRRRELLLHGERVAIGQRAFDLLTTLVARRGRPASKRELMAEVWAATVVDENNLAAQISALRKVLAADPTLQRGLQTLPGRGYCFVADVALESPAGTSRAAPPPGDAGTDALSLVVMPFANLSSDIDEAYFAHGLSHTVATDLSRIAGLSVISSATAAALAARNPDARQLGRELGARYVLSAVVQRSQQTVRINAQLADGQSGLQAWSERFDADDSDPLALHDRITGRIANAIGREIFVAAAKDGAWRRIDPKCFDFVMRGIAADNRPQSLQSLQDQEALFAQAVNLDPGYADAHARLARAILLQLTQVHAATPDGEAMLARGVHAAETALALDPANPRAHCSMGLVHVLRGDFQRAVQANQSAIALDRNDAIAHNNLGNSQLHLGHGSEALHASEAALRLDPHGPQVGAFWTTQGYARLLMGEIDAAVGCFSRARVANPRLPRAGAGAAIALALRGDTTAARQASADLLKGVPHYRLSQTIDACLPTSPARYRRFHEDTLRRGAQLAGLPV